MKPHFSIETPIVNDFEQFVKKRRSLIWSFVQKLMGDIEESCSTDESKQDIAATFLRRYPAYKSKQLNVSELARVCDISRTTVYKYIGLLET